MTWLILGLIGLLALLGLLRLFADAKPAQVKTAAVWGAAAFGALVVALLVISGRAGMAFWALAFLGPMAWRNWKAWQARRTFARGGAASAGQASDVETSHLAMGLDHDSGRMFGRVKTGRFAGQDLTDLDLPLLLELLTEIAATDPEGVPLLEAWLDRAHPDWRATRPPPADRTGPMTRQEALSILGLADGASEAEIRSAHRRLMLAAHPDHGGSDWLAARLNEARDVLLG